MITYQKHIRRAKESFHQGWEACLAALNSCPEEQREKLSERFGEIRRAIDQLMMIPGAHQPPRSACRHMGNEIGREKCLTCGGHVEIKVFKCAVHAACTLRQALPDRACCNGCPDFLPDSPAEKDSPPMSEHLARLNDVAAKPHVYPEGKYSGRGIVIGAGGAKFFACAWACVHTLRSLGCTLPVEFWYLDRYEMDPTMAAFAEAHGIVLRDASKIQPRPRILNGWELKPFAVIHSAFEEVLYLDADNIPVHDPTYLFEAPEYQRLGAIFWPDIPPNDRKEWLPEVVWKNCGMDYRDEVDFETGQYLINKRACWKPLQVTMHMNEWSDYYYQFVFGDKSTFHLAWRKCGVDYAMPPRGAGWVWPALQQYDLHGRLIFQHACRAKESIVSGDSLNTIHNRDRVYEAARIRREHWSGLIWDWHHQTEEETRLAHELAVGRYKYDRVGIGWRAMTLADGGQITEGGDRCEKRWSLRILDGVPTLAIVGEAHKGSEIAMMLLTQRDDGAWVGRWSEFEKGPVELTKV